MHQLRGAVNFPPRRPHVSYGCLRRGCATMRSIDSTFSRLLPVRGERAARLHAMAGLLARLLALPPSRGLAFRFPQWLMAAPPSSRRLTATGLRRTHTCFPFHRLSAAPRRHKFRKKFLLTAARRLLPAPLLTFLYCKPCLLTPLAS